MTVNRLAEQHYEDDDCLGSHCYIHGVDENPERAFHCCFECGHVYPSGWALYRDHMRVIVELVRADIRRWPLDALRMLAHNAAIRPARIACCAHCSHDF